MQIGKFTHILKNVMALNPTHGMKDTAPTVENYVSIIQSYIQATRIALHQQVNFEPHPAGVAQGAPRRKKVSIAEEVVIQVQIGNTLCGKTLTHQELAERQRKPWRRERHPADRYLHYPPLMTGTR